MVNFEATRTNIDVNFVHNVIHSYRFQIAYQYQHLKGSLAKPFSRVVFAWEQ